MPKIKWVTCDGGPHLVLPRELVAHWEGSSEPSGGRVVEARFRYTGDPASPATDYDAACDVEDVLGLVPAGPGHALVLGDDVPMSAWIPEGPFPFGTLVVPLAWPEIADSEDALRSLVTHTAKAAYRDTGLLFGTATGGFVLCAACDAKPWIYAAATFSVPAGQYLVFTTELDRDGFLVRLHALARIDD